MFRFAKSFDLFVKFVTFTYIIIYIIILFCIPLGKLAETVVTCDNPRG